MKKQSTLFPQEVPTKLAELDLEDAKAIANKVKDSVSQYCDKIEIAGSIRRQKAKVHDIDFVVVTKSDTEWQKIIEELKRLKAKPNCQGTSIIKALLPCQHGFFQIDFYRAQPSTFGILLLIRTGSAEHNIWLAGLAHSKGFQLKYSSGLMKDGVSFAGETEESVFSALDLPCPVPQLREVEDRKPKWQIPN